MTVVSVLSVIQRNIDDSQRLGSRYFLLLKSGRWKAYRVVLMFTTDQPDVLTALQKRECLHGNS